MPGENYVDVEAIVKDWARAEYDAIANKKQKKLREKERTKRQAMMNIKIDWSEVDFVHETHEFPVADDNTGKPKANGPQQKAPVEGSGTVSSGLATGARPTTSVLFRTTFKNRTDREQEYTMKTEKTTKSAFMTECESGYTKGFDMSVTLKTPCEVFEANAGYHREYSLTNTTGETFEEELHWGVDSVIKVKENHVAEAQLVVFEEKKNGSFQVKTTLSGRVYAIFTNIRDNNSFVMATSEDICTILDDHVTSERRRGHRMDFIDCDTNSGVVTITTKGTCKFQYGIRQEVQVDQKQIPGLPNDDSD